MTHCACWVGMSFWKRQTFCSWSFINQPTPFFGAWRSTSGLSLFGIGGVWRNRLPTKRKTDCSMNSGSTPIDTGVQGNFYLFVRRNVRRVDEIAYASRWFYRPLMVQHCCGDTTPQMRCDMRLLRLIAVVKISLKSAHEILDVKTDCKFPVLESLLLEQSK